MIHHLIGEDKDVDDIFSVLEQSALETATCCFSSLGTSIFFISERNITTFGPPLLIITLIILNDVH